MWRQHQNLNRQLPHFARIPHVLSPFSEMRVGDLGAWSSPADPHQLQPAFWSGGQGVQVRAPRFFSMKNTCANTNARSFRQILSPGAPIWSKDRELKKKKNSETSAKNSKCVLSFCWRWKKHLQIYVYLYLMYRHCYSAVYNASLNPTPPLPSCLLLMKLRHLVSEVGSVKTVLL